MNIEEIIKGIERVNRKYSASVMGLPDAEECEDIAALRAAIALLHAHPDAQSNHPKNGPKGFRVNDDMFGCYVKIQTGRGKDMHVYKVLGLIESNGYCDTPIMGGAKSVWHSESVPVLNVVHCGVSEDTVIRVALSDCEVIQQPNEALTLNELREMGGEPVWVAEEQRYAFLRVSADYLAVTRNRLQWDLVCAAQAGKTVGGLTFYRRRPEEVNGK